MSRVTVLVIDDDPDQHTLCGVFLEHSGYAVLHAFDGQEGVAMARAHRPAVVLMDIRMPRMDGIAARRALAADPATGHIPVVAVSADVLTWPEAPRWRRALPRTCPSRATWSASPRWWAGCRARRRRRGAGRGRAPGR